MKKLTKKIVCSIALCGAVAFSGFGLNSIVSSAAGELPEQNNTYFEMEGASVRLSTSTGLRFTAKLGLESYDAPTVAAEGEILEKTVSYGVFIFPLNRLQQFMGADYDTYYTTFVDGYDYLNELKTNENKQVQDYLAQFPVTDMVSVPVAVDEDLDGNTDYYRINGSLTNVLYNNIGRDFFGLAYKKVGTLVDEQYTYEYTYAEFSDKSNVWNLAYVASSVYISDWQGTENDYNILKGFVEKAMLKKAGLSETAANATLADGNLSWSLTLNKESAAMKVGDVDKLTFTNDFFASEQDHALEMDVATKFVSSATDVVEVAKDGTLTAKKAGQATITVTCLDKTATCEVTVGETEAETYNVTVNYGSANVVKAAAGDTVTLTANPAESGYEFAGWEVTSEQEVVIEDNQFKMPACDVTVTATYRKIVAREYLVFEEKGGDNFDGNNITAVDNKSITVNVKADQYANVNAYVYMRYGGLNAVTETKLTFTVTNNTDSELIIDVGTKGNYGGTGVDVVKVNGVATNGEKGRITVAGNESVVVTVEFAKAINVIDNGGFRLCFYPYAVNKTAANFTVSKVYAGEAGGEEPAPELTQLSVPELTLEGNVVSWTAVANAVGYEYKLGKNGEVVFVETTAELSVTLSDSIMFYVRAVGDQNNYTSSDWATVEYNVTQPESELKFARIDSVSSVGGSNMDKTAVLDSNGISLTIKTDSDKAEYKGVQFKYNGLTFEKKTLSLNVTNSSNITLQLGILFDGVNVEFEENGCLSEVSISGRNAVCVTLGAGESTIVTVTATGNENFTDGGKIELRPFIKSTDFEGTFTISEIYNGKRASKPKEPDETMYTLSVTDGVAKADGQEITSALAGTLITLEANAAPDGKVFDKWVGNVTVVDNQFTMPNENVSVQATYKDEGPTEPEL